MIYQVADWGSSLLGTWYDTVYELTLFISGHFNFMEIKEFQNLIARIYYEKDAARGVEGTFRWFVEEVGELARSIRKGEGYHEEFADVAAWLFSLANLMGVDMEEAIKKYQTGCPKCGRIPCVCGE